MTTEQFDSIMHALEGIAILLVFVSLGMGAAVGMLIVIVRQRP